MVQMELLDQLAARVGLHPAILLMKVRAWTRTNERKGQQQKDGRYWMYNSIAAWHAELPYLSEKQIRTALTSLRNNGYLLAEKAKNINGTKPYIMPCQTPRSRFSRRLRIKTKQIPWIQLIRPMNPTLRSNPYARIMISTCLHRQMIPMVYPSPYLATK